ncbi:MAG: CHASE2 domain-containing protein [Proteobacteria bacterium]|nr:CHASE2 domain-containing protein [Pseudomonadota bacterium]
MSIAPSRLRRLAVAAGGHAARVLPPARGAWAEAMRRELDHIEDDRAALRWAVGCVLSSYRARLPALPTLPAPIEAIAARIGAPVRTIAALVRGPSWLLAALLVVLLGLRIADWRPFALARDSLFDLYQTTAPSPVMSDKVVVVEIDEASLAALGQWPWSRAVVAALTRRLTEAGAIVGFDIVFVEPDRLSPDRLARAFDYIDPALARALAAAPSTDGLFAEAIGEGRVVLAEFLDDDGIGAVPAGSGVTVRGRSAVPHLPHARGVVRSLPLLARTAAGSGFLALYLNPDPDGVVRHMPMLARVGDHILPGLALELARVARATEPPSVEVGWFGIERATIGGLAVPTDRTGEVWPNFALASPRGVSAHAVLEGGVAPGSLAGRIAIIGASAAGLRDIRQTPVGHMPGVYLHARALRDMLAGTLLRRPGWAGPVEIALMIASGLGVIVVAGARRRRGFITFWLVSMAATVGASVALHRWYGLLTDATAPVIATTVLVFAILLIVAQRQDRAKAAFPR